MTEFHHFIFRMRWKLRGGIYNLLLAELVFNCILHLPVNDEVDICKLTHRF